MRASQGSFFSRKVFASASTSSRLAKRAVRLLITETPQGRHLSMARDARVFRHDESRIKRSDEKQIEGSARTRRLKRTFRPAEIERTEGLVKKYRPPGGPDDPGDGNPAAVGGKLVTTLPTSHEVDGAATVELGSALPQSKQRHISGQER